MLGRSLKKTVVAALFIGLAGVLGCAQAAEKATEKAIEEKTGVDVETEKSGVLKKVDTSDIPKELLHSGAKATEKVKVNNPQGAGEGIQLNLETSDSVDEVASAYGKKMEGAGWEEQMKMEQEMTALTYTKDKSWATLSIEDKDGKTKITVLYIKDLETPETPGSP